MHRLHRDGQLVSLEVIAASDGTWLQAFAGADIAERYDTATLVTSKLDFTEWDQAFPGNRTLAWAIVRRLRHNAYCLTLGGASYRAPRQGPNRAKSALASTSKNIDS